MFRDDTVSPKLGAGIDALAELSKENYINGAIKLMLIVGSDGTSSDDALPAAEYANSDFQHNIIAVSVRKPATDLLSKIAGLPTRFQIFSILIKLILNIFQSGSSGPMVCPE